MVKLKSDHTPKKQHLGEAEMLLLQEADFTENAFGPVRGFFREEQTIKQLVFSVKELDDTIIIKSPFHDKGLNSYAYEVSIHNGSERAVELIKRKSFIKHKGEDVKIIGTSIPDATYLPGMPISRPWIIKPNQTYSYVGGLFSESVRASIQIEFDAIYTDTRASVDMGKKNIDFKTRSNSGILVNGDGLLSESGAGKIRKYIVENKNSVIMDNGSVVASFRPDRIAGLDVNDLILLVAHMHCLGARDGNSEKERSFDFSSIVPERERRKGGFKLNALDHFVIGSDVHIPSLGVLLVSEIIYVVDKNAEEVGARLRATVAKLIREEGFAAVYKEVVEHAPASNGARDKGMATNEKLPRLKSGLKWPEGDFNASKYFGRHGGIVKYLDETWKELIKAGVVNMPLLRKHYPETAGAIHNYTKKNPKTGVRRKLPQEISVPYKMDLTDRAAEAYPDPATRPASLDSTLRARERRARP